MLNSKVEKEIGTPRRVNVINFWAPWCKPCAEELPALREVAKRFKTVAFAGISVETKKLESVSQAVAKYKMAYPQFIANSGLMESFFGPDGEAPLPATLVFDKNGALVRSFFRAISAEELSQVLHSLAPAQTDAKMLRWMGERAVSQGYLSSGVSFFEKGLEEDPESVLLLVQLGGTLSGQEQHEKAIRLLKKATRTDPNFSYAWHVLGKAYSRAEQAKKALKAHKKATELRPEEASYLLSLGAVYMRLKKAKPALAAFEKATELEPRNVLAWLNLGKTRAIMKKPKVIEAFDRVLNLIPEHEEALMLKQRFIEVQVGEAGAAVESPSGWSVPAARPGSGESARPPF
jgi:tetratricopeptide (TPR) repeat protein